MIGGEPCAVDRVIKSKQEVMFRGHSVFNDYILKDVTVNETDKVNQPVVTKTWWQVEKVHSRSTDTPLGPPSPPCCCPACSLLLLAHPEASV